MNFDMHMNFYLKLGSLLIAGLLAGCQSSKKGNLSEKGENSVPVTTHRALNPIAPPGVFIADPEVRQMPDGRVYVYGSRDEPGNRGVQTLMMCSLLQIWWTGMWNNILLLQKDLESRQIILTRSFMLRMVFIIMGNIIFIIVWQLMVKTKGSLLLLHLMARLKREKR